VDLLPIDKLGALIKFKNRKTAGTDEINLNMLKYGGITL
jgi:hypothetical protein